MPYPVTHDSDTWLERRWAIQKKHATPGWHAQPFRSEQERDAWVAQNPSMRQAVGKRHPAVKALRAHWRRASAS